MIKLHTNRLAGNGEMMAWGHSSSIAPVCEIWCCHTKLRFPVASQVVTKIPFCLPLSILYHMTFYDRWYESLCLFLLYIWYQFYNSEIVFTHLLNPLSSSSMCPLSNSSTSRYHLNVTSWMINDPETPSIHPSKATITKMPVFEQEFLVITPFFFKLKGADPFLGLFSLIWQ